MPRTATIGPAIYEEVNKLVAEGKTRTEAFAAVAKKRKARNGTVAANYYRVARQQGEGRKLPFLVAEDDARAPRWSEGFMRHSRIVAAGLPSLMEISARRQTRSATL